MTPKQRAHVRQVADLIEEDGKQNPKFDMEDWFGLRTSADPMHPCDTTACIAGYSEYVHNLSLKSVGGDRLKAALRARETFHKNFHWAPSNIIDIAAKRMGLNGFAANFLFHQYFLTAAQAVRILRALADTAPGDIPEGSAAMYDFIEKHKGRKRK